MHLGVAQVDTLDDEALPELVVGRVVEVLGGEGRAVNGGKAPVGTGDDVLFNQVPRCSTRVCPRMAMKMVLQ